MDQEWNIFKEYGNRTSSFMSMYPGLEHFKIENGQARGITFGNRIVLAAEPHCDEESRAQAIIDLKNSRNKKLCLFPIGEKLASVLEEKDFSVWQIGSEPIFELNDYFLTEPLDFLPLGRTLKKRGAVLVEILPEDLDNYKDELETIHENWKQRKSFELGFLNQVDPFFKSELKRWFILKVRDTLQAFMTAVPFCYNGAILGYYFNDIIRSEKARAGSNELLIVEVMRTLHGEGTTEVRLGMAPLSRIKRKGLSSAFLDFLFRNYRFGYNFKGHYHFKNKLRPTRWDNLYLSSSGLGFLHSLICAINAHFPKGLWVLAQTLLAKEWGRFLELSPDVKEHVQEKKGNNLFFRSLKDYLFRTKWTHAFVIFFVILHLLKVNHPVVADLFTRSAYIPSSVNGKGLLLCPLFHNDLFHLFGDQLSFYIFGIFVEGVLGTGFFFALTLAGLFLSNPLTHALVDPVLKHYPHLYQEHFLHMKDYGSSNAVFTLIGGTGASLKKKAWLLVPFLLYAVFIAMSLESFLAIHHIAALYLGYAMIKTGLFLRPSVKKTG